MIVAKILKKFGYVSEVDIDEQYVRSQLNVYKSYGVKNDLKALFLRNAHHISLLKRHLPFNESEFDLWVMPLIDYIARYYMLLPSSYEHHHRDPGGAFIHALETANHAISNLNKDGRIFQKVDTEFKVEYKFTTPLVLFILCILHDTGKPISDFEVLACDKSGNIDDTIKKWEPTKDTLAQWLKEHNIEYYRAFYISGRIHNNHEFYSGVSLNRLDKFLQKFKYSETLIKQINETLLGSTNNYCQVLRNLALAGDRGSTKFYMESYGRIPRDTCNSARIIEALESFYFERSDNENLLVNHKPYFHATTGLHIHYPKGLEIIYNILEERGFKLPSKNVSVADVMVKILSDSNHLLIVGENSQELPAVHNLYVQLPVTNNQTEERKVRVISIKQPHLFKLLESDKILPASLKSNADTPEVIPLSARAVTDDNEEYYEQFSPQNEPAKKANVETEQTSNDEPAQTSAPSQEVPQPTEQFNNVPPDNYEQSISQEEINQLHEQDVASQSNSHTIDINPGTVIQPQEKKADVYLTPEDSKNLSSIQPPAQVKPEQPKTNKKPSKPKKKTAPKRQAATSQAKKQPNKSATEKNEAPANKAKQTAAETKNDKHTKAYLNGMGINETSDPEFMKVLPLVIDESFKYLHRNQNNQIFIARSSLHNKVAEYRGYGESPLEAMSSAIKMFDEKIGIIFIENNGKFGWVLDQDFVNCIMKDYNNEA